MGWGGECPPIRKHVRLIMIFAYSNSKKVEYVGVYKFIVWEISKKGRPRVGRTEMRYIYNQKNLRIATLDEMYYITQSFPE